MIFPVNTSAVKCRISKLDEIPIIEYLSNGRRSSGKFLLACDAKHLTDFEFDPSSSAFVEGQRSVVIEGIEQRNGFAIKSLPSHLFATYEHVKSFLLAELVSGASVLLRTLLEFFVTENFVVDCFGGNALNLKSKNDSKKFESILIQYEKHVTTSFALEVLAGNITDNGNSFKRLKVYRRNRSNSIPKNSEKDKFYTFYVANRGGVKLIDETIALELYKAFNELSEAVHGRHSPNITRLDDILEYLLQGYGDYLNVKGNTWMVIP